MEVTPRQSSIDPMGGGTWEGSALLSHLSSATQYEAKVLPHNFFGFTQPKQVFNFATKGAVPYHQPSTSGSGSNVQFITASLIANFLVVSSQINNPVKPLKKFVPPQLFPGLDRVVGRQLFICFLARHLHVVNHQYSVIL